MRDIKFRAWSALDNKMKECDMEEDIQSYFKHNDGIELMQYTGLKDKNGKEIYEGDILKKWYSRDTTGKDIIWFYEPVELEITDSSVGFDITFLSNSEVVGNIYENAELLK